MVPCLVFCIESPLQGVGSRSSFCLVPAMYMLIILEVTFFWLTSMLRLGYFQRNIVDQTRGDLVIPDWRPCPLTSGRSPLPLSSLSSSYNHFLWARWPLFQWDSLLLAIWSRYSSPGLTAIPSSIQKDPRIVGEASAAIPSFTLDTAFDTARRNNKYQLLWLFGKATALKRKRKMNWHTLERNSLRPG